MDDETFKRALNVRGLVKCGAGVAAQGAKTEQNEYIF